MNPWVLPVPPAIGVPVDERARLSLFDTASDSVRPTDPGPVAGLYVCGITPYDATHLGHAATYVAFDLVTRAWRDLGHDVHHVQNVTDVDDPLLERATATGRDWRELAAEQIDLFAQDMTALSVLPPRDYVGAVESIPAVLRWIDRLTDAGATYRLDDDVYLDVGVTQGLGRVSGLDRAAMLALSADRGGDPERPGKRDPLDCLLWQAQRPGEPAWEGPLGAGRPGWHIECTAIALDHLGMGFDVQGGGSDLAFPHHEMCACQARTATGKEPFAQHFVHAGMVGLDGEKMSKSLGNLVLVSELRAAGEEPVAIRLALLAHHYRSDWMWTGADLAAARARVARWRAALATEGGDLDDATALVRAVRARIHDDLDAPGALALVDRWAEGAAAIPKSPSARRPAGEAGRLVERLLTTLLGVHLR